VTPRCFWRRFQAEWKVRFENLGNGAAWWMPTVSSIIRHETKWWMRPYPQLDKVIEVALGRLEHKRLLTLFHRYPTEILKLMPKKDLPLMVPEVHGEYLAGLLESRLNPRRKPTTVFLEP
jgi:hypothetical protein